MCEWLRNLYVATNVYKCILYISVHISVSIYTHRIHAMYTYLHLPFKNQPHVGKYTIYGSYGILPYE